MEAPAMKFQPLIIWWLLLPFALAGFVAIGYWLWRLRHQNNKQEFMSWVRRGVLYVMLILMVLGISVPGGSSSPGVANLDVVFALDTTSSMGAQDYTGGKLRLEGAKQDMLALAEKLRGAHFALVTFDSKANVALPFTSDSASFTAAVQAANREIYGTSKGSSIDKPIDVVLQQLKNSKAAHPERSRLLFYVGDGEQTNKEEPKSFKDLAAYVNGGAVLGYGTAEGARMLRNTGLEDGNNDLYVNMLDPSTKKFVPATSKIDEEKLKKIGEELGVNYHNRNTGGVVDGVYRSSGAELLIDKGKKIIHYINLYWLFAVPLVGLLFWEWRIVLLLMLQLRKDQRSRHA